jgi:Ser/Thr protein kinase RdoA (MazF antagonist)
MRERPPLGDGALAAALAAGLGVAAVPALDGDPWRPLGRFTLLVYPWVDGVPAMGLGLTGRQWVAHGRFVAALHRTGLPADRPRRPGRGGRRGHGRAR